MLGLVICLLALAALTWQRATTPQKALGLVVMVGLSFAIESGYRALIGRKLQPTFVKERQLRAPQE